MPAFALAVDIIVATQVGCVGGAGDGGAGAGVVTLGGFPRFSIYCQQFVCNACLRSQVFRITPTTTTTSIAYSLLNCALTSFSCVGVCVAVSVCVCIY